MAQDRSKQAFERVLEEIIDEAKESVRNETTWAVLYTGLLVWAVLKFQSVQDELISGQVVALLVAISISAFMLGALCERVRKGWERVVTYRDMLAKNKKLMESFEEGVCQPSESCVVGECGGCADSHTEHTGVCGSVTCTSETVASPEVPESSLADEINSIISCEPAIIDSVFTGDEPPAGPRLYDPSGEYPDGPEKSG